MSSGAIYFRYLVNLRAVFHVVGHPGRSDDEVDLQIRVFLQLREEAGLAFQHSARSIMPPSGVGFLDSLPDLKEPPSA